MPAIVHAGLHAGPNELGSVAANPHKSQSPQTTRTHRSVMGVFNHCGACRGRVHNYCVVVSETMVLQRAQSGVQGRQCSICS